MSEVAENNTEVVSENVESVDQATEVQATEDDYSWVPKKFLKDGKPDLQGLAKSYSNLEKRLGSRSLASEAIEDYAFESKHGFQYDPEVSTAFKSEAQKMGVSPEQYAWMMEKYEEAVSTNTVTPEVAEKTLRESWGKNFDSNLNYARAAWDAFAPSDMDINEVGNNPAVLKILARVGAELGEDKPTARQASRPTAMTEDQINEIIRSKDYTTNLKKQEQVRKWYEQHYSE
ncbi:hypothetical protein [Azonexus hydrophilus]|uniref:hypothetical protein n=1 Tax=Azonexus hydrophilus TaxID=418702 RepID=UPI0012F7A8B7|nr:hypothetical protein [Azonexus hydrophilus]